MNTGLEKLLSSIGLEDLGSQVLGTLRQAAEIELAQKGAKALGRACCETLDTLLETAQVGTLEQRTELAVGLADAGADQLERTAELLRLYPAAQAEVVAAKQAGDSARLKAAREARNRAAKQIQVALAQSARAVAGEMA